MSDAAVKVIRMAKTTEPQDLDKSREIIRAILEKNIALVIGASEGFCVETKVGDKTTQYLVDIPQQYFGRLLGSKGKNISALRTLVATMAMVQGFRAIISIKDEDRFF